MVIDFGRNFAYLLLIFCRFSADGTPSAVFLPTCLQSPPISAYFLPKLIVISFFNNNVSCTSANVSLTVIQLGEGDRGRWGWGEGWRGNTGESDQEISVISHSKYKDVGDKSQIVGWADYEVHKIVCETLMKISNQLRGPLVPLEGHCTVLMEDLREGPLGLLWKLVQLFRTYLDAGPRCFLSRKSKCLTIEKHAPSVGHSVRTLPRALGFSNFLS